jgi:GxxExxY protein
MALLYEDITEKILKGYYEVYNTLGYGFLEKVYENSLVVEFRSLGLKCEQQKPIDVYYKGVLVGEYFADIIVNDRVIVELKASNFSLKNMNFNSSTT